MKSLFVVNVRLPEEYREWVNEIVKAFVLLASIHILQQLTRGGPRSSGGLFNADFWKLVVFVAIGFSAYYLVVRKLVRIRYVGEGDSGDGLSLHSFNFSLVPDGLVRPINRIRVWLKEKL